MEKLIRNIFTSYAEWVNEIIGFDISNIDSILRGKGEEYQTVEEEIEDDFTSRFSIKPTDALDVENFIKKDRLTVKPQNVVAGLKEEIEFLSSQDLEYGLVWVKLKVKDKQIMFPVGGGIENATGAVILFSSTSEGVLKTGSLGKDLIEQILGIEVLDDLEMDTPPETVAFFRLPELDWVYFHDIVSVISDLPNYCSLYILEGLNRGEVVKLKAALVLVLGVSVSELEEKLLDIAEFVVENQEKYERTFKFFKTLKNWIEKVRRIFPTDEVAYIAAAAAGYIDISIEPQQDFDFSVGDEKKVWFRYRRPDICCDIALVKAFTTSDGINLCNKAVPLLDMACYLCTHAGMPATNYKMVKG